MGMGVLQEFCDLRQPGGFGLIMADPPWRFSNYSARGGAKSPAAHYDCMSLRDLEALPVQALAAEDCLLWLWATNPMLPQALALMDAWGFEFKTAGTWVKRTRHGKDAFGTGYVFRSSNEPILIGTRGRPRASRGVRSTLATYEGGTAVAGEGWPATCITIEAPVREHSRKPDAAFDAAEQLMPDAQRCELFSRQSRPGWHCWGHEVGKFDGEAA